MEINIWENELVTGKGGKHNLRKTGGMKIEELFAFDLRRKLMMNEVEVS